MTIKAIRTTRNARTVTPTRTHITFRAAWTLRTT